MTLLRHIGRLLRGGDDRRGHIVALVARPCIDRRRSRLSGRGRSGSHGTSGRALWSAYGRRSIRRWRSRGGRGNGCRHVVALVAWPRVGRRSYRLGLGPLRGSGSFRRRHGRLSLGRNGSKRHGNGRTQQDKAAHVGSHAIIGIREMGYCAAEANASAPHSAGCAMARLCSLSCARRFSTPVTSALMANVFTAPITAMIAPTPSTASNPPCS